jgi:hypothetical protein
MYSYDVFVSYKRHENWDEWYRTHLLSLLRQYLHLELKNRDPSVFIDKEIKPASDWPRKLGLALAQSRILIPCLSSKYFESPWCTLELELMLARKKRHRSSEIVWPLIVHNCETLPGEVGMIQSSRLEGRFFNPDIVKGTLLYQEFSEAIRIYSPSISTSINSAPDYDPQWEEECIQRFEHLYSVPSGRSDEITTIEDDNNSSGSNVVFPSVKMS